MTLRSDWHWEQEGDQHFLVDRNSIRHAFIRPNPDENCAYASLIFWDKPVRLASVEEAKQYVEKLPVTAFYWPG